MEVSGHQPAVDRVLAIGDTLIKARHFAASDMTAKQQEVRDAWQSLLTHSADRRHKLSISLLKQQVRAAML